MSHQLHEISVEDLQAEIQKRRAGEVQAMREAIAGHRSAIAALEAKIATLNGGTAPRAKSAKFDQAEADNRVLFALGGATAHLPTSQIALQSGIEGLHLKASLARLEAAGKVKRHGKARATVYGVA